MYFGNHSVDTGNLRSQFLKCYHMTVSSAHSNREHEGGGGRSTRGVSSFALAVCCSARHEAATAEFSSSSSQCPDTSARNDGDRYDSYDDNQPARPDRPYLWHWMSLAWQHELAQLVWSAHGCPHWWHLESISPVTLSPIRLSKT